MGDTHVYMMWHVAPTPRSQHSELQNLHKNSPAGLHKKIHIVNGMTLLYGWHGFEQRITNKATDKWCKRL